jgi:uncharacterized LabA/DUF88 family protein
VHAETRLKIAVFIDFDNIEIGVKSTLGVPFDVGLVLEALKERGEVVAKTAYSDWKRAGDYSRTLSQHAIKMVQRTPAPGGDKNGADINLALDALEMAFTHPHINAYVIVGGDSDFISLVEKLKQYDKTVFVVGGRSFTSAIMQRNCHEFIAYENLLASAGRRAPAKAAAASRQPIAEAFPLVRRALEVLADREVSPQLGLLKSTLLQLDSTFSERNYGASSFRDFAERLEKAGLVRLRHNGRNILVELAGGDGAAETGGSPAGGPHRREALPTDAADGRRPREDSAQSNDEAGGARLEGSPSPEPSTAVGLVRRLLAAGTARFPLYLRSTRQLLRALEPGFDERRLGYASLVDLLRAAQREGLVRLERDSRGALRVFPGEALPAAPGAAGPSRGVEPESPPPSPAEQASASEDGEEAASAPAAGTVTPARRRRTRPSRARTRSRRAAGRKAD